MATCDETEANFYDWLLAVLPKLPKIGELTEGECCTNDEMQGLRVRARCLRAPRPYQGEGSVLTYVTEPEFR